MWLSAWLRDFVKAPRSVPRTSLPAGKSRAAGNYHRNVEKQMKSAASLLAFLLAAMTAHAQTSYEQLSPTARKSYDACTDAAASKPTTEGVRIAMSTCNRRFFSEEPSAAAETMDTESLAAAIAEGFNKEQQLPEDVISRSAVAIGKQVIIKYKVRSGAWAPDSLARRKKFENLAKDGCEVFSAIPEFTTGGLSVTYIYDDDEGNRLAKIVASQKQCELIRYR